MMSRQPRRRSESLEPRLLLAADTPQLLWSNVPESKPDFAEEAAKPTKFSAFRLNDAEFQERIETTSPEFMLGPEEPADLRPDHANGLIQIPSPNGKLQQFQLLKTKVMSDELAKKLPGVATYRGFATDGSNASIRVTTKLDGIHAQVRHSSGHYYVQQVDQADPNAEELYMSYYLRDLLPSSSDRFTETVNEHLAHAHDMNSEGSLQDDHAPPPQQSTGAELRTYRMAVAATGEFTTRHGGTVESAQEMIVQAINDANDLYENQMSIRFVLVDNTSIVYTDADTDPYTNNDNREMLSENQTNIDNVIGNANYDIGHVFGTNGGGVASVGVAGRDGVKARGVSSNNLNFSTQTVSHEIGHQFSSRHTWNGANNSCSPDQWNQDYSMEPGSGSTIMSYGGFCGVDNIQTFRDNYFHSVSFDGIVSHAINRIPSVGTVTTLSNSPPNVSAGPDYTIPAETAFELMPPEATDFDGDTLVYNWEQRDLGGAARALADGDDGAGPLFRTYAHSTDRNRTFPRLAELLNNDAPRGEILPTTTREINFRLTALDGNGGNASDNMKINVVATGSAFSITSPNTNVSWAGGTTQMVSWNVAGTLDSGIGANNVDILLSTDGGLTFDQVLASSVPNDGSQPIVIPNTPTANARLKITPTDNIFFDISNANFTITEQVFSNDFGDAPNSYGTLQAGNGPVHTATGPILGSLVDTEADGQPSSLANADGIDEDSLGLPNALVRGTTGLFQVSTITGGELDMFIDFDGDGVFGNTAAEIVRQTLAVGSNDIAASIPADAVEETFVRLRISSAGNLGPGGSAPDGEVEDHAINIFATVPDIDYGDLVDFPTTLSNDGARHAIGNTQLGSTVDSDLAVSPNQTATSEGRDDDGIYFHELLSPGATSDFEVITTNGGVLDFFIDFDGNRIFAPNESFSTNVSAGSQLVPVSVPADAVTGVTYGRFRLSSAGGLGPDGLAQDGEVEDYQMLITSAGGKVLLGDFDQVVTPQLPAGWSSVGTVGTQWTTVTSNSDSTPHSVFAPNLAFITDVELISPAIPVVSPDTAIRFRHFYNTESTYDGGVLEISNDGGASWQDITAVGGTFLSGEYNSVISEGFGNPIGGRAAWSGNSGGFITSEVQLPNSFLGQDIQLRFRFGSDSSLNETGWWVDTIEYDSVVLEFDFGDAMGAGFPTLVADAGAAHGLSGPTLGALRDAETDGQPTANADGDGADDDGVTFPASLTPGTNEIEIITSADGIINLWIDLNDDGDWDDAVDHIIKDLAVTSGTTRPSVNLPEGIATAEVASRVRLSSQAGLPTGGVAGDGEVEDYRVNLESSVPVTVESVVINGGNEQRSTVESVEVTFSDSATVPASAFVITNRADTSTVPISVAIGTTQDDKTRAIITFLEGANVVQRGTGNSLGNGNYQLQILSSMISNMESDFLFGTEASDNFFRFFGDSDGDRDVDGQDYGRFGSAFLTIFGEPNFNSFFDFDGDEDVDGQDYGQFGIQFLQTFDF